jgi:hypothetical protein
MKKLQTLLAAALCGAVFSFAVNASAEGGNGYATVVRVIGIASYSLGDGNWHPLLAGKYLPAGSVIRTGHNGVVDVVLGKAVEMPQAAWQPDRISLAPDSPVRGMVGYKPSVEQNVVRLVPETTLGIDKLTVTDTGADTVSDTELDLQRGKIFASVKKLNGASQYLIKLPSGIAGVRGTKFSICADGTTAVFESQGGGVVLSLVKPDGSTQTFVVVPGQSLDVTTGQLADIQADLGSQLANFFKAIQTIYQEVVNYSYDNTQCYVSPTHGGNNHHHNGHDGGGGQGGGGFVLNPI